MWPRSRFTQLVKKVTSQNTISYLTTIGILEIGKEGSFYNFWFSPLSVMNDGQHQGEFALMEILGASISLGDVKKDSKEEVELEVNNNTPNAFLALLKYIKSSEKFLILSNPIIDLF